MRDTRIEQDLKTQLEDIRTVLVSPKSVQDGDSVTTLREMVREASVIVQAMLENSHKMDMPESYSLKILVDGNKHETMTITPDQYSFWDESGTLDELVKKVEREAFSVYSEWEKKYRGQTVEVVAYSSDGDSLGRIGG